MQGRGRRPVLQYHGTYVTSQASNANQYANILASWQATERIVEGPAALAADSVACDEKPAYMSCNTYSEAERFTDLEDLRRRIQSAYVAQKHAHRCGTSHF